MGRWAAAKNFQAFKMPFKARKTQNELLAPSEGQMAAARIRCQALGAASGAVTDPLSVLGRRDYPSASHPRSIFFFSKILAKIKIYIICAFRRELIMY